MQIGIEASNKFTSIGVEMLRLTSHERNSYEHIYSKRELKRQKGYLNQSRIIVSQRL